MPLSSAATTISVDNPCCLFPDGSNFPTTGNTYQEQVNNCGASGAVVLSCEAIANQPTYQCCFDGAIPVNFGENPGQVSTQYCQASGYTPIEPDAGVCAYPTNPYHIKGTVNMISLDGTTLEEPLPLPDVLVEAVGFAVDDNTGDDGTYDLGDIPGVPDGLNTFLASASSLLITYTGNDDQFQDYVDEDIIIQCEPVSIDQELPPTTASTPEQTVNFNMHCEIDQDSCIENWEEGGWDECVLIGNQWVQTQTVTDLNNCGTTENRPPTVVTEAEAIALEIPWACEESTPISTCGNEIVEGFEQCDGDQFVIPGYSEPQDTSGTVSCSQIYPNSDNNGSMNCLSDCTYNTVLCEDPCVSCDGGDECDTCSTCTGSPLCTDFCENPTPLFYAHLSVDERTGNRNVLESYVDPDSGDPLDQDFTGVVYTQGSNAVTLEWDFDAGENGICTNELDDFKIRVCKESAEGNNQCAPNTMQEYIVQGVNEYTINNLLEENTNYCYNVCSQGLFDVDCAFTEGEPLPCFNSGDAYCHEAGSEGWSCELGEDGQEHPYGCFQETINERTYTNHTQQREETCEAGTTCVQTIIDEPSLLGAACVELPDCERCNGFLGLYASYEIDVITGNLNCPALEYDPNDPTNTPQEGTEIGSCLLQQSTTRYIDEYSSCQEISTCYDYTTQRTCEQDSCFKFSEVSGDEVTNGCEWNNYAPELGVGVCAPVAEQEQECKLCDTDSPTGICDESMCGAFGSCYFKEQQNHDMGVTAQPVENTFFDEGPLQEAMRQGSGPALPACIDEAAITCFFYENEQDCVGENPVSHDIEYLEYSDPNIQLFTRSGGTHERTPSNDRLGLGTCKWVDNIESGGEVRGCFKDSDNSIRPSVSSPPLLQVNDDCFDAGEAQLNAADRIRCLYDHEPPNTTVSLREAVEIESDLLPEGFTEPLPLYGESELDEIIFTMNDNEWSSEQLELHWSVHPYDFGCTINDCPDGYPVGEFNTASTDLDSGVYALLYYAQDRAKNLEVVNFEYIYIDGEGPELASPLQVDIETFEWGPDMYRSNLTITMNLTEAAACDVNLLSVTESAIQGEDVIVPGSSVSTYLDTEYAFTIDMLPDGNYEFRYTCYDDNNNHLVGFEPIDLDGNPAITNPYPRGEIFSNFDEIVEIRIETFTEPATCRYDVANVPYDLSQLSFTSDGTEHTDTLFDPDSLAYEELGIYEESGSFIFFPSCHFPENADITYMEQDPGDVIYFTVDMIPPTVAVEWRSEGVYLTVVTDVPYADERTMRLTANDTHEGLLQSFGVQELEYCIGAPTEEEPIENPPCFSGINAVDETKTLELIHEIDGDARVYYRASDMGENQGPWQVANPKLRNTDFIEPNIYFIE